MADCNSYSSETLFSFEVLVEYIKIHKPGLVKRGFDPAVGVRLLDFPTLVIYRGEKEDCERQEDSDSEKENAATDISTQDALLQQHMDRTLEYPFRKGKSCLFKINLDLLHTHLSNVPLYVMVLDSRNEIPKLLGSSMVSLAKTIDVIKTDVKQLGICTPSAQGEKGLFGLYNLMGEKIGCISLGYKLLSLGASLIPHIPESRVLHLGSSKTPVKQPLKPSDNFPEANTCRDDVVLQPDSSNALYQHIELDGQRTDVVVSETETEAKRSKHGVSTGTQTEPARRRVKSIEVERREFDKDVSLNVYCPPPLYYSCPGGRQEEEEREYADGYRLVDMAMEALTVEDLHEEEEEQDLPVERRSVALPEEVRRRSAVTEQSQAPPSLLGDALRRLPLLSALLQELSQLSGLPQELPAPVSAPAGLAWGRQPAPAHPPKPHPRSCVASPASRGSRSPSPRPKRSQAWINSAGKDPGKVQRQSQRPGKANAPKSPPKRKLVHGLTRTVRLRLQQNNPEVLREQERREQAWRSRAAALKQATRGLHRTGSGAARPGHRLPGSPRGRAVDRSANLDENVQTLVSSVDVESVWTGTPSLSGESGRGGTWRTGSRDNGRALPFSSHYEGVSRTAAGGKPAAGQHWTAAPGQNRTVQVRIPSALSQHSDHSDGGGPPSDASDPWHPQRNNPGFQSGSAGSSPFSSPALLRSESCRGSPDRGEYLDDFTSLEPTEGFSPDPPESPEPAGRGLRKQASHSDSDSQERRRPQTSRSDSDSQERRRPQTSRSDSDSQERRRPQTSRSDSDSQERRRPQTSRSDSDSQESRRPAVSFPVKSDGSPQRSLKGTHVIRPRTGASAISLSSGDSELAPGIPARHRGSGASRGPSLWEESGGSGARLPQRSETSPSPRASPADSHLLSESEPGSIVLSPPAGRDRAGDGETLDELGSLGFSNKCHHISELVLSKLPGYTL